MTRQSTSKSQKVIMSSGPVTSDVMTFGPSNSNFEDDSHPRRIRKSTIFYLPMSHLDPVRPCSWKNLAIPDLVIIPTTRLCSTTTNLLLPVRIMCSKA